MDNQSMESEERTSTNDALLPDDRANEEIVDCIINKPWLLDPSYGESLNSKERFLQTITRTYYAKIETTLGLLCLAYRGGTLRFVSLEEEATFLEMASTFLGVKPEWNAGLHLPLDMLDQVKISVERQVAYEGPLDYSRHTPFQQRVLEQVRTMPPGEMWTHAQVAQAIGRPRAGGAVGRVLAHNPFPLVIPCHRVIRTDGMVGNYTSGGSEVKKRLLRFEGFSVDKYNFVNLKTSQATGPGYKPATAYLDYGYENLHIVVGQTGASKSSAFSSILHNLATTGNVSPSQIQAREQEPFLQKAMFNYLNWVVDRYDTIHIQGVLPYVDHVQLTEIYSPSRIRVDDVQHRQNNSSFDMSDIFIEPLLAKEQTNPYREHSLNDVIRDNTHIILLGPPGAGKTVTLRHLALSNARKLQTSFMQEMDGSNALLPIPLQLSDFVQCVDDETFLPKFLMRYFARHGCLSDGLTELIETSFMQGRCLILLDGLDEVPDYIQLDLARWINRFVAKYSHLHNRFIITCRTTDYYHNLPRPFIHCIVQGMNKEDISFFLQQWEKVLALRKAQQRELSPCLLQDQEEKVHKQNIHDIWLRIVRMTHSRIVHDNSENKLLPITPLLVQIVIIVYYAVVCRLYQPSELSKLMRNTVTKVSDNHSDLPRSALDEYLTSLLSKVVYKQYLDRHARIGSERSGDLKEPLFKKGEPPAHATKDPQSDTSYTYPNTAIEEIVQVIQNGWSAPDSPLGEDSPDTKLREDVNELLMALKEQTDLIILPTKGILTSNQMK